MRKSNIDATFKADIQKVWNIVTDNENYAWRSDLSKIEILDGGRKFIEYTKDGFSTTFTITVKEDFKRYELDMDNKNFTGHWIGIFSEENNGETKIDFTEELKIKNFFVEIASYLFMNLKKMQLKYITDLKKELER